MARATVEMVEVRVSDLPEVKAALDEARQALKRVEAERDQWKAESEEWEQRYEWLLSNCGGVSSP